ncbi:hypothetical protein ABT269_26965 [Streptomyces viridosporus]|uniref:hypothetical protein n=1 Tax=Streptomyces viridosporus TaxID=67581 RepID=UPI00331F575C
MSDHGLLHRHHRLLGRLVRDTVHDRIGILQAIAPDTDTTTPVAWLRPPGGGTEWTTPPTAIVPADTPTAHPAGHEPAPRTGGGD